MTLKALVPTLAVVLVLAACGSAAPAPFPRCTFGSASELTLTGGETIKQYDSPPQMAIDPEKQYQATMHTSKGTIVLDLFASEAPKTVNNFACLARDGFYDGVRFHRILKGFMIQGGDPTGTGAGGPGYSFEDEPVTRDYVPGILAMANAGPNTNGSQFFIMHGAVSLPKQYTIFGQVVEGMDVVDAIAQTPVLGNPRGEFSVPTEDLIISSIEIQEVASSR